MSWFNIESHIHTEKDRERGEGREGECERLYTHAQQVLYSQR